MNVVTIATVAMLVALYGALLSTILAVCRFIAWRRRRRGQVKVTVDSNYFMRDPEGGAVGPWVRFKAVNDGKKPVKITGLTVKVGSQEIDLTPRSTGTRNLKIIGEGEDFDRVMQLEVLLAEIGERTKHAPPYKCKAVFHNNTGRKWKRSFILVRHGENT